MNLKDLWIGDLLRIKSSGKVGSFEGSIGKDIAILKIDGKKVEVLIEELKLYTPPKEEKEVFKKVYHQPKIIREVADEIDLHLEKLTSDHMQILPEIKLDYQVNACISYIQRVIESRKAKVSIIHGKGSGTLKAQVHHLIKDFKEIYHSHETNDGGALEIWLRY